MNEGLEKTAYTKSQQRAVLLVIIITAFLATFLSSAISLSIPQIEVDLKVSAASVGWVITSFILTMAAISVPIGKFADVRGRTKVLRIGIIGIAVSAVLCGFSGSFVLMIIFRILQGIFSAMMYATNNAILISVYPDSMRGKVLGISIAFTYIGLSVGPVLGGLINHYVGWRYIFFFTALLAFIALAISVKGLSVIREVPIDEKIDTKGSLLFMVAIVLTLYGLTNLSVSSVSRILLGVGIVILILFVLFERKQENPVIKISMFSKSRAFTCSNLAALLNYGATYAISYLMSIYLQVVKGLDSQTAGFVMIAMPLLQAIFTPYMGKLSDRVAPYKLATGGMAICVASLVMMSTIQQQTPLFLIILYLACAGFSFAMFSSPNTNAVMSIVDRKDYATANSILATMRTSGQCISMAIVTIVIGFLLGNTALENATAEALMKNMRIDFLIFAALCALGVYFSLQRRNARPVTGETKK